MPFDFDQLRYGLLKKTVFQEIMLKVLLDKHRAFFKHIYFNSSPAEPAEMKSQVSEPIQAGLI